jgi:S-adenosylmethionine-dependent methyltransferase
MTDDIQDIRDYYNADLAYESARLQVHQLERDLTWRYFTDYLPKQGLILEIGAATGAHTLWLARHGYTVVAVDIAEKGLEENRKTLTEAGLQEQVNFRMDDARTLKTVPEADFDAVLLMGPLYHLVELADRQKAVQQAVARLRTGGMLFSSFISRFGILGDLLKNVTGWIEELEEVHTIIERGRDPADYHKGQFRGYFATTEEIIPLHEQTGMQTLVLAGVEPAISADDESYNRLEGRQRQLWQDLLYRISREPSMVASSRHLLYIGRKP